MATADSQSLADGEAATVLVVARAHFVEMLEQVAAVERSGPLYYALAWGWTKVVGMGDLALRSLSVLLGALAVPAAYVAGREVGSPRAGLLAALLVAVSPYMLWFAHEARSYGPYLLLTLVGLALVARAANRQSAGALVGWAVVSAAALATHYFAVFTVAAEAAWLLVSTRRRAILPVAAVATVALALLPLALHQSGRHATRFANAPIGERLLNAWAKFAAGDEAELSSELLGVDGGVAILAAAAGALVLAGLALSLRAGRIPERRGGLPFALALVALVVPLLAAVIGLDYVKDRNLAAVLPLVLVGVSVGLADRVHAGVGLLLRGCWRPRSRSDRSAF